MHILSPETDNCPSWISGKERMTVENISWSISTKECCRPRRGLNPRPPGLQSDGASNWATEAGNNPQWSTHISFSVVLSEAAFLFLFINLVLRSRPCCLLLSLTISALQTKKDTHAISKDPDEMARNVLSGSTLFDIVTNIPFCNSGCVQIQTWKSPLQKLRD